MSVYPIEGLMNTAMNSIKEMIDVNTIIGEPIETSSNVVIIPVSKVNFGFAAGGSEFKGKVQCDKKEQANNQLGNPINNVRMPFGGGSGAGVSISPIAFIVVQPTGVKLLPIEHGSSVDKLLDLVPDLIDKLNLIIEKQVKKFEKGPIVNATIPNTNTSYNNTKSTMQGTQTNNVNSVNSNINPTPASYDVEYDETSDM